MERRRNSVAEIHKDREAKRQETQRLSKWEGKRVKQKSKKERKREIENV